MGLHFVWLIKCLEPEIADVLLMERAHHSLQIRLKVGGRGHSASVVVAGSGPSCLADDDLFCSYALFELLDSRDKERCGIVDADRLPEGELVGVGGVLRIDDSGSLEVVDDVRGADLDVGISNSGNGGRHVLHVVDKDVRGEVCTILGFAANDDAFHIIQTKESTDVVKCSELVREFSSMGSIEPDSKGEFEVRTEVFERLNQQLPGVAVHDTVDPEAVGPLRDNLNICFDFIDSRAPSIRTSGRIINTI